MASIRLAPLIEIIEQEFINVIESSLAELGAPPLDEDNEAESILLDGEVDDDLFVELLDRLESAEAACDIYVPPNFEDPIQAGEYIVGSSLQLINVLEDISEDLFGETPAAEYEEDDEGDYEFDSLDEESDDDCLNDYENDVAELKGQQLLHIWTILHRGAKASVRNGISLIVER